MRSRDLWVLSLSLAACGPSIGGDDHPDDADARQPLADGSSTDGEEADFSRVYAHSGQVLYRLDTTTLMPVEIGPFTNIGTQSITDIAIDKNDRMVGITLNKIYTINVETGAASLLATVATENLTSLSFIPDLTTPDSEDRLVAAASDGTVYDINQISGAATRLGSYGMTTSGDTIASSGDIVAVAGFGIFATVNIGTNPSDPDYLAQINPTTWQATPLGQATGFDRIFGLGFWRGKIYGFVDRQAQGGAIIEINANTGLGTLVNSGLVRWFGAGVTTDAPVVD